MVADFLLRWRRTLGQHVITCSLIVLALSLASCGGGGGGGSHEKANTPRRDGTRWIPSAPTWTGTQLDEGLPWVNKNYLPDLTAITADENYVYAASAYQVARVNKATNEVEPLAGFTPGIQRPRTLAKDGESLFFLNDENTNIYWPPVDGLFRMPSGPSGLPAISTLVPRLALGPTQDVNYAQLFASEQDVYWVAQEAMTLMSGPYGQWYEPGPHTDIYTKSILGATPPEIVATFPGNATLVGKYPHFVVVNMPQPWENSETLYYRLDLVSRTVTATDDASLIAHATASLENKPTTVTQNGTALFWLDGTTLLTAPTAGGTASAFLTGLQPEDPYNSGKRQILADDTFLYVVTYEVNGDDYAFRARKYDIATKEELYSYFLPGSYSWGWPVLGNLWWPGPSSAGPSRSLWRLLPNGQIDDRCPFIGEGYFGQYPLLNVNGVVFAGLGAACNVATGDVVETPARILTSEISYTLPVANASTLFFLHPEQGIVSIPGALEFSRADEVLPDVTRHDNPYENPEAAILDGFLFWTGSIGDSGNTISRIPTAGGDRVELFHGETRGLQADNGLLYFGCQSDCGYTNWTVVSMAPEGGAPTPIVEVGPDLCAFTVHEGTVYTAQFVDYISNPQEGFHDTALQVDVANLATGERKTLFERLLPGGSCGLSAKGDRLYLRGWWHPEFYDPYLLMSRQESADMMTEFRIPSWDTLSDPVSVFTLHPISLNVGDLTASYQDGDTWYYWWQNYGLMRMDMSDASLILPVTPTP